MGLKTFKPYTKSVRGTILVDKKNLWKGKPFKSLTSVKNSSGGRNNLGRLTSRNTGGGHKQKYRNIDFYRKKFGEKAEVERIEYDPNRTCHIMLIKFPDGERFYYLAPKGINVGDKISNGPNSEIKIGNCLPLSEIPVGIDIHNVEINPGGYIYNVAIHELGHNLGMSHPFAGYPDTPGYAESYYANSLFTVMAYAAFWSKELDIYESGLPQNYTSYADSISGISKDTQYGLQDVYGIALLGWGRDDILTIGHMYGLRDNYNAGDNIYSWDENKNIYETIHDMGGNDTVDLSNYVWDMDIDLSPGGVSEVGIGQERIHWNDLEGEKTGDVFILSWETTIENYIGSTGSNTVTLNNKISNNIDLSISEDKNIIYNAITSDIIFGSSYEDYFYVTISNLEEINDSINIDGGADFDWLVIEAPVKLNSLENIDTIEISKNNDKALVALKENTKGIEVLDLNFLNVRGYL